MLIGLAVLLIAAIVASIIEGRTHVRLARTTMAAPLPEQCRYCGEPAPQDKYFPLCTECEAAELTYLTATPA